jgi:hypothetical protein
MTCSLMCRPKSLQGSPEGVQRSEFGGMSLVDTVASVRETTLRGNHRTEATEVTEEGIRVEHRGFGARTT